MNTDFLCVGAGLTNLSLAWNLEKQGLFNYKLVEAGPLPAGLLQTSDVHSSNPQAPGSFKFDYTGHFLHVSNPAFQGFLETVFGLENFNVLRRQSYIFSHAVYTPYPFQKNLFGLPESVIKECIEGFASREVLPKDQAPENFHHWVLANFGSGLGKHFFFPYNQKLFCKDLRQISATWTGRFVPNTTLEDLVKGSQSRVEVDYTGYNGAFLYPKTGGISRLVDAIASKLKNKILCNEKLVALDAKTKIAKFASGLEVKYKKLVSTIPLNKLLPMVDQTKFKQACHALKHNSVVNINIGLDVPNISQRHWVYFPEPEFPFYRMGFWHNFNDQMAPKGCSSIYLETSTLSTNQDEIKEIEERSIDCALKFLGVKRSNICAYKTHYLTHAYVLYDNWRDQNLPEILQTLEGQSIYSIGRFGAWKYSSMQEAFLDGAQMVEKLTQ